MTLEETNHIDNRIEFCQEVFIFVPEVWTSHDKPTIELGIHHVCIEYELATKWTGKHENGDVFTMGEMFYVFLVEVVVISGTDLIWDNDAHFALTITKSSLINSCKLNTLFSQVLPHVSIPWTVVTIAMYIEDKSLVFILIRCMSKVTQLQFFTGIVSVINQEWEWVNFSPLVLREWNVFPIELPLKVW